MVSRRLKHDSGILSTFPKCFNYCRSIISGIAAARFHSARFGWPGKGGCRSDARQQGEERGDGWAKHREILIGLLRKGNNQLRCKTDTKDHAPLNAVNIGHDSADEGPSSLATDCCITSRVSNTIQINTRGILRESQRYWSTWDSKIARGTLLINAGMKADGCHY